jgi:hypothetical protein
VGEEELDPAQRNGACGSGPFSYIFIVQKVLPEFFFGHQIRRFLKVLRHLEHGPDVQIDGCLGHAAKLQIVNQSTDNCLIP